MIIWIECKIISAAGLKRVATNWLRYRLCLARISIFKAILLWKINFIFFEFAVLISFRFSFSLSIPWFRLRKLLFSARFFHFKFLSYVWWLFFYGYHTRYYHQVIKCKHSHQHIRSYAVHRLRSFCTKLPFKLNRKYLHIFGHLEKCHWPQILPAIWRRRKNKLRLRSGLPSLYSIWFGCHLWFWL